MNAALAITLGIIVLMGFVYEILDTLRTRRFHKLRNVRRKPVREIGFRACRPQEDVQ